MSEHQNVVDAFTDTPQAGAMKPVRTKHEIEGDSDDASGESDIGAVSTDDLTIQGGE